MTTRKNFQITANGKVVDVRHAWNAANRSVEKLIGEIALAEGSSYRLTHSESEKVGFNHVRGVRVWSGENGRQVRFEINQA